ncbi:hypothetical protein [Rathayibacter rathayi]|nr:hypothetical protein [Rathayibacter rathayi]
MEKRGTQPVERGRLAPAPLPLAPVQQDAVPAPTLGRVGRDGDVELFGVEDPEASGGEG